MNDTIGIETLASSRLANSIRLRDGETIPAGTEVRSYVGGAPAAVILPSDTLGNGVLFKGGTSLYFHPTGEISQGTLARNETISMRAGLFEMASDKSITFAPAGGVTSGHNLYEGRVLPPWDFFRLGAGPIWFHESGSIFLARCIESIKVTGPDAHAMHTRADSRISLWDPPGEDAPTIMSAVPAADTKWSHGLYLAGGYEVVFGHAPQVSTDKVGYVRKFHSPKRLYHQGYFIDSSNPIHLHGLHGSDRDPSRLQSFHIDMRATTNGVILEPQWTVVGLHENRNLSRVYSAHSVVVNGVSYPPLTDLRFDGSGVLIPSS